jgi:hypothetical protein
MFDVCLGPFLVHFHICLPVNDKSLKLVESVSNKAIFTKFGVVFIYKLVVKSMQ